jgi:predicted Zn-dependent peptidase
VSELGASLGISAGVDATTVSLTVLKKNFGKAFSIFADVVVRPQLEASDFKRVSDLWRNDLKSRADEPSRVAQVVNAAVLYGPGTPYGHPSDGLMEAAEKIDLSMVKKFYAETFRPDRAVLVVAGDITRAELTVAIDADLGSWKAPKSAAKKPTKEALPAPRPASERPKIVLVDRPKAPQSVIAIIREGVMASEPDAIRIDLVNTPLGGSFTSRLNQNLREEKHWAYGAGSYFLGTRGKGAFWAMASVETAATGPALKEALRELEKMAKEGPTAEELDKAKAQDRADLLSNFETISSTANRLSMLARLGLPPTYDADAGLSKQSQTLADVASLAKAHVDPASATIVVVGPKEAVWKDLLGLGLGEPAMWDAEGKPVVAGPPAKAEDAKDTPKDAPKDKPKGK